MPEARKPIHKARRPKPEEIVPENDEAAAGERVADAGDAGGGSAQPLAPVKPAPPARRPGR